MFVYTQKEKVQKLTLEQYPFKMYTFIPYLRCILIRYLVPKYHILIPYNGAMLLYHFLRV